MITFLLQRLPRLLWPQITTVLTAESRGEATVRLALL